MEMIEVKTAELIGKALDWSVGTAQGWYLDYINEIQSPQDGWGRDVAGATFKARSAWRMWHDKTGKLVDLPRMNRVKECDYKPSTEWAISGPLIEKFILELKFCVFELPQESWKAETHESWANGSTALVASMRAIVNAMLGDTVSVPKELMQ